MVPGSKSVRIARGTYLSVERRTKKKSDSAHGCNYIRGVRMALNIVDNLPSTLSFAEVDTNAIQLAGLVTNVGSGGVNAVLSGHDLRNEAAMNHGHWRDDKKIC